MTNYKIYYLRCIVLNYQELTIKDTSIFDTKTLSSLYDSLISFNKVVIEFKELDIPYLNDITEELIKLEIWIGRCSFHEEDGCLFEK